MKEYVTSQHETTFREGEQKNTTVARADTSEQQVKGFQKERQGGKYDALILDATLRQSLVAIRSFGQRGMRVAAMEIVDSGNAKDFSRIPAFSSRWCQQSFAAPGYEQGLEPFLTCLQQAIDTTGASVLITSSDATLALLRQYREDIERRVHIALAKESALAIAVNKKRTLEVAQQLGIAIPRGIEVRSVSEVEAAVLELGLPVVIKPVKSWLWGEEHGVRLVCKVAKTLTEARLAVEILIQEGGTTLFQQFLSGRRESVNLMYAHDVVYARFAQWAKRTYPQLGGTSVYRQSIAIPTDIGEQAEHLVREIELEGYAEIEFRRDNAGRPYLMEINPRLSASIELAVRCGVDFPYLLYQWANGNRIDRVESYQVGKWMRHLGGDINSTIESFTHPDRPGVTPAPQAVLAFLASFFVPAAYDYFDSNDPTPAWKAIVDFVQSGAKQLSRKIASS